MISIQRDASLSLLYQEARSKFTSSTTVSLKHGFPPRVLEDSPDTTLKQAGLQNQDRILVVVTTENDGNNNTTTIPAKKKRPSQRASAKAASESFGEVIRAQDMLMRGESGKKKSSSSTAGATNKRKRPAKHNNRATKLSGRRLQDGATVGGGTKKPRKPPNSLKNEQDVSMALLNALNGSGGGGKVGAILRAGMRNAISNSYEASRAVQKVAAIHSNQYNIEEREGKLYVEYSKGVEGRGMFQESCDAIEREALQAVVSAIYNSTPAEREMLKAVTLAQVSPRVFWSLVWLYRENTDITTVEQCLSTLLPELDWTFQKKRKRELSNKARENLRQQHDDGEDDGNVEAAQEAVQAVEDAMEQLGEFDASQRRERAARAALSRHAGDVQDDKDTTTESAVVAEWKLTTPTEQDDEELQECIATTIQDDEKQVKTILAALYSLGILNWRQLANADATEISQATKIPVDQVECWMDYAQKESVEELVVEICDNRVDVVEVLRDEARTGTVKDLANWKHMPDLLYSSAPSLAGMGDVEVSDVRTWCQRAQQVLEEYEWVQWYATPVE